MSPFQPARAWLAIEFLTLFVAVPVAFFFGVSVLPMIPTLLAFTGAIFIFLLLDPTFDRSRLWAGPGGLRAVRSELPRIVLTFVGFGAALTVLVMLNLPERFLEFPRERPRIWAMVMVLYPVFSVYPQEVVWRAFLHHRYRQLMPTTTATILTSALAFGLMHIVFRNWIAVVLCVWGGVLFARTYERTRSTLAVVIEHALYGCLVFTIGLGWYFYGGSLRS